MPEYGPVRLPYVHRVTKFDPADRDELGRYTGPEDIVGDCAEVEAAYLRAVEAFAAEAGVDLLSVREPQLLYRLPPGAEPTPHDCGLGALFADWSGFHDGAQVPLATGLELVRIMLREGGVWCRLEVPDVFAVHVGWDQYLYVGTGRPCPRAPARARALGLFPEPLDDGSPYDVEFDGDGDAGEESVQRPADDEFWAFLRWAVNAGEAGVLEERWVEGATRWHRLTPGTLDAVRAGLTPRARLGVWPQLSSDVGAVLAALPDDGLAECVWQDGDGGDGGDARLRGAVVAEDRLRELRDRLSGADAAMLLSPYAGERVPLCTAVVPDADGVVRARRRTDPSPGDRRWARLKTLRRGQVVEGTVTKVADFGVTFVDIGGFEAMINIPELSWYPFDDPSEVVSVGQRVRAEILDVDFVRERVPLSLKALQEDPLPRLAELTGRTVTGRVTALAPSGVCVRIEDAAGAAADADEAVHGLVGLVPDSELDAGSSTAAGPASGIRTGDLLRVRVLDVDTAHRRITLSQRRAAPEV